VPLGNTGPDHEDDAAVADDAGEGAVRMAQDRWCIIQKLQS